MAVVATAIERWPRDGRRIPPAIDNGLGLFDRRPALLLRLLPGIFLTCVRGLLLHGIPPLSTGWQAGKLPEFAETSRLVRGPPASCRVLPEKTLL